MSRRPLVRARRLSRAGRVHPAARAEPLRGPRRCALGALLYKRFWAHAGPREEAVPAPAAGVFVGGKRVGSPALPSVPVKPTKTSTTSCISSNASVPSFSLYNACQALTLINKARPRLDGACAMASLAIRSSRNTLRRAALPPGRLQLCGWERRGWALLQRVQPQPLVLGRLIHLERRRPHRHMQRRRWHQHGEMRRGDGTGPGVARAMAQILGGCYPRIHQSLVSPPVQVNTSSGGGGGVTQVNRAMLQDFGYGSYGGGEEEEEEEEGGFVRRLAKKKKKSKTGRRMESVDAGDAAEEGTFARQLAKKKKSKPQQPQQSKPTNMRRMESFDTGEGQRGADARVPRAGVAEGGSGIAGAPTAEGGGGGGGGYPALGIGPVLPPSRGMRWRRGESWLACVERGHSTLQLWAVAHRHWQGWALSRISVIYSLSSQTATWRVRASCGAAGVSRAHPWRGTTCYTRVCARVFLQQHTPPLLCLRRDLRVVQVNSPGQSVQECNGKTVVTPTQGSAVNVCTPSGSTSTT